MLGGDNVIDVVYLELCDLLLLNKLANLLYIEFLEL